MGVNVTTRQAAPPQRADAQRSTLHQPSGVGCCGAPSPMRRLQRAIGNRAMTSLLRSRTIQPKLTVSHPNDEYEREADRVADQVMRMPDSAPGKIKRSPEIIQRACHACDIKKPDEESHVLQAKRGSNSHARDSQAAVTDLQSYLSKTRERGESLLASTRSFFESRFGHDFSQVRIHSDSRAAEAAQELDAHAFTVGSNVYFASGRYDPGSISGQRLLSHELTHVVQQGQASSLPPAKSGSDTNLQRADSGPQTQPPILMEISPAGYPDIQRAGAGAAKAAGKRALRWLGFRGKTITRHVARHTRRIAGRAVHSVFRSPNQVKKLVHEALKAPHNVLVQSRGRLRYVVEKQFNRVIGRNGETIIHVVFEASGKIITAYPIQAFTAASVAFIIVDEATVEAREQLDDLEERARRATERAEPSFWEELAYDLLTFGLYGGELNAGEGTERWVSQETDEILKRTYENVIRDVEEAEQATLGPDARAYILELVNAGLTDPDLLDELESEAEGE